MPTYDFGIENTAGYYDLLESSKGPQDGDITPLNLDLLIHSKIIICLAVEQALRLQ